MAANLNTELNLAPLLERILDNPYGLGFCAVFLIIILFIVAIFFIAKSGIINSIREHQEYKVKKVNEEIKYQEDLLKDESFKKYKSKIKYNLDVERLGKLLKYKHHDKDLLEYIYSCKNSKRAIQYYESSQFQLEKDQTTGLFKLKKYFPNWCVMTLNYVGTAIYFSLTLGSLAPTFYIFYYANKTGESLSTLPTTFYLVQLFLFFICFVLALFILSSFIKPWKGKKFLELEKIEEESD